MGFEKFSKFGGWKSMWTVKLDFQIFNKDYFMCVVFTQIINAVESQFLRVKIFLVRQKYKDIYLVQEVS